MWNYLRVRGEYVRVCIQQGLVAELPPRARRIHPIRQTRLGELGTTSACAENTCENITNALNRRNYLRVRGEYRLSYLQL